MDPVNSKKPRRRLEWPIRPDLPLRRGRKRPAQRRDCEILFGYGAWEARSEWRRREAEAEAAEAIEAEAEAVGGAEAEAAADTADAAASATANVCQAEDEQAQRGSRKRSREEAEEGEGDQRSEQETRRAVKRRKEVAFVEGRFHCEVDCDYPTQCSHTVYRAFKRGRAEYGEDWVGYVYVGEREL